MGVSFSKSIGVVLVTVVGDSRAAGRCAVPGGGHHAPANLGELALDDRAIELFHDEVLEVVHRVPL